MVYTYHRGEVVSDPWVLGRWVAVHPALQFDSLARVAHAVSGSRHKHWGICNRKFDIRNNYQLRHSWILASSRGSNPSRISHFQTIHTICPPQAANWKHHFPSHLSETHLISVVVCVCVCVWVKPIFSYSSFKNQILKYHVIILSKAHLPLLPPPSPFLLV